MSDDAYRDALPSPGRRRRRAVAVASPGSTYDRLARTALHRWWRPPLASLLVVVAWLVTAAAAGLVIGLWIVLGQLLLAAAGGGSWSAEALPSGPLAELAFGLVIIAVTIPAVMFAARAVQRRPAGSLVSVTGRLRWRWFSTCAGVATLAVVAVLGLSLLLPTAPGWELDLGWVGWTRFSIPALVLVALVPLQSAGEEFLFRGWIVQCCGAYLRTPWVGIGLQAVLFAGAHGLGTVWGFADLVVFAVVVAWLTLRTGGLEAAIALHAVNNVLAFLLAAAAGELSNLGNAADAPWQLFAVDVVLLLGYAGVVDRLARQMRIARTTPAAAGPAPIPGDALGAYAA